MSAMAAGRQLPELHRKVLEQLQKDGALSDITLWSRCGASSMISVIRATIELEERRLIAMVLPPAAVWEITAHGREFLKVSQGGPTCN